MAEAPQGATAPPVRQFLTFRSSAQYYALPAVEVAEIIRMPPVTRLPHSPAALLGMANLRGNVIAVASLRLLLGQPADQSSERAVLLRGSPAVAFCVDHVDAVISLRAEPLNAGYATEPARLDAHYGKHVRGTFQLTPDAEITEILDIHSLLAAALRQPPRVGEKPGPATRIISRIEQQGLAADMLISFDIDRQEYALRLEEVQEILPFPANIAVMLESEPLLLGVITVRDIMLPLLSLRSLLGSFVLATQPETAKIVVTRVAGVPVGLVVDRIRGIVPAPRNRVKPAPALLVARMGSEARVRAIYRENADRIISVLSLEALFAEDVMARLANWGMPTLKPKNTVAVDGQASKFLVFLLNGEEFGLPITVVDEIAEPTNAIAILPKKPKIFEGLMNWRGVVLPVINGRRRLKMPEDGFPARRRIIVVRTKLCRACLLVDEILGFVTAAENAIQLAPALLSEHLGMIDGLFNLEVAGRMILLLDPDLLLSPVAYALPGIAAGQKKIA